MEEREVTNYRCGSCKYFGINCKCIDHSKVNFARSCFSCDDMTAHHAICSAFECVEHYPALYQEWKSYKDFWEWYALYREQWLEGREPETVGIIKLKPRDDKREVVDDVWMVPYKDFLECKIMKPDGIHYTQYRHIERSWKSVTGYQWTYEGEGVLEV